MTPLEDYLTRNADLIDKFLDRHFGTVCGDLGKASAHLLLAGGKRLRPAVTILAAESVRKGSGGDILPAAVALELTHTFTLIHDDIMDGDATRRGVPTVHTKWNGPTAILAGDVLYASAFEYICLAIAQDTPKVRAMSLLARTCVEICEGQHQDMSFADRTDVSEGEYLEMVRKKTGALYAAAAGIGAILGGGKATHIDALISYGMNTGIAFQIQDDLIDIIASTEKSGKDRGSDIREGKQTLITILARSKGIDLTRYRHNCTDKEIDQIIRELEEKGVIADVQARAKEYVMDGKKCLSLLPDSEERDLLLALGDFFVTRGS